MAAGQTAGRPRGAEQEVDRSYLRTVDNREAWEAEAENWVRWARTPGHDAYWYYANTFFDSIVPSPGRLTLEVGSGEGRVTRDLLARGHNVVAVDGSETLLRYAVGSDSADRYVMADAACLPIDSGSVDLAVAYNSLMDFDDMPTAVAEVARVLAEGGAFCICLTHPILNGGGFDDDAEGGVVSAPRELLRLSALRRNLHPGPTEHSVSWMEPPYPGLPFRPLRCRIRHRRPGGAGSPRGLRALRPLASVPHVPPAAGPQDRLSVIREGRGQLDRGNRRDPIGETSVGSRSADQSPRFRRQASGSDRGELRVTQGLANAVISSAIRPSTVRSLERSSAFDARMA